ncbi:hypothetical protein [Nocardioides sp.]|uniref:hypothetical protein n=1 Tax=Nocardioides sp. TaxID=35761 RepID=UPI002CACE786|nr:hypothetical protein [Nocardioides sp.]HSX68688.1 hypothetical protein [Nocardioides sp.]
MKATAGQARSLPDGAYVATSTDGVLVVPGRPQPENPGAPALQVVPLGATAVVQAGFCWPMPEDAVRRDLAPGLALRSAVRDVPVVELRLHGPDGVRVLATSTSSGYPPYTAVLSVTVDSATAATVGRALEGEPGLVSVVYRAHAHGLTLDPAALEQSATRGVAIGKDREVTASVDISVWARHDNEQD